MLGITLADAAVVCTITAGVVAILRGSVQGDAAKRQVISEAPMVSIAGGIVDSNQFADYVKVGDKLAIALTRHADALDRQHDVKNTNALEELANKIDDLRNLRGDNPHRRR